MSISEDVIYFNLLCQEKQVLEKRAEWNAYCKRDLELIPKILRQSIGEYKNLKVPSRMALSEIVPIASISHLSVQENIEGRSLFQELWDALLSNIQKDVIPDPLALRALPAMLCMLPADDKNNRMCGNDDIIQCIKAVLGLMNNLLCSKDNSN
jgi:hypothetical protein